MLGVADLGGREHIRGVVGHHVHYHELDDHDEDVHQVVVDIGEDIHFLVVDLSGVHLVEQVHVHEQGKQEGEVLSLRQS